VALRQLRALGLTGSGVRKRVASGRLHRVHAGVYAVGHANLTGHGHWMGAVLACGQGAVLSYRSSAALHGVRPDHRSVIDVTSSRRSGRGRRGIVAHQGHALLPRDSTTVDAIPCTSLPRTLLDLAEVIDRRGLERALDRAEQLRVLDMSAINDVLARAHGRPGAKLLREVLAEHYAGSSLTASELEERFLLICRGAGVPAPDVNAWVALPDEELKADFLWRHHRLIVEVDGHETHGTRQAFERDRRRDQCLTLAGYSVIRFTCTKSSTSQPASPPPSARSSRNGPPS